MENKILSLRKEIEKHNKQYYVLDDPIISDKEYDLLMNELLELEDKYPEYDDPNSPSKKVGGEVISGFKKYTHKTPMLSLDNTYSKDEILKFVSDINKQYGVDEFVVEMKIDGIAMGITYENGELILAATRGDGIIGEEVTANAKMIQSVPLKLTKDVDLTLRGEVFMPKSSFILNNERLKEKGLPLMANARNAAAGTMRQLNSKIVKDRRLDAFWYTLVDPESHGIKTHSEALEYLNELGLKTNPYAKLCSTPEEVWEAIEEIENLRETLDFDIDGAVIKVNSFEVQKEMGFTSKSPRFQKAFKYEAEIQQTVIEEIFLTVGRTGRVTPNAKVKPVIIDGTVVSYASLHNEDYVKNKDLRVGDVVNIRKAAEIIPEIVSPIKELRTDEVIPYEFPRICPRCGSNLVREEGVADTFCINISCPAQAVESIIFYASRDAMDIKGLGESTVLSLYEKGVLSNIVDIYTLKDHKEDLMELDRMGEKSINNLLNSIEETKTNSLDKVLTGLGIRNLGKAASLILANNFKTIDNIMNATKEDYMKLEGFGDKLADSVFKFFSSEKTKEMIDSLKEHGLTLEMSGVEPISDNFFNGKTVVISGTFNKVKRKDLKDNLFGLGAKVTSAVSKNTDILIAGEKAGSKLNKAIELGIKVISEDEYLDIEKDIHS